MSEVQEFFDPSTSTLTYVVYDRESRDAVVIDPLLDYDPAASVTSEASVIKVLGFLRERNLKLHFILETHAHADHLSGCQVLKREFPAAVMAIGAPITQVQETFKKVYGFSDEFKTDGSQFDRLLKNEEILQAGALEVRVLFTPGHTPACVSYSIDNNLFVGDALFMPDYGTGRCDFPGGSAEALYFSIHDLIYKLPQDTYVYTGHDYLPGGRPLRWCATLAEQTQSNLHLRAETTLEQFVAFRSERDRTLPAPRLLLPSLQINLDAGRLPPPEVNGRRYLKIPIA